MGVTNSTISSSRRNGRERIARPRLAAVKGGVWPEFSDGSWPECCDGPAFNMTKVEELADDLQNYWPTLYCSPPRQCNGKVTGNFWQHEREKHGTCAFPIIPNEATFFKTGSTRNTTFWTKYKVTSMMAAIQKATGFKPVLVCQNRQIKEIYLCFNKNFQLRHCGNSVLERLAHSENLQKPNFNGYVLLPPVRSAHVEVM